MTDPAIIAASYAAERNYSHNTDDVIDASDAVLAIGTEKLDTTTLKDRSLTGNDATIHGAMQTSGYFNGGRRYDGDDDNLDCGSDSSIDDISVITIEALFFPMSFGENNAGRIVDKNQKLFFMSTDLAYIDTVSFYHGFSTTKGQWHTPDYSIVLNQWHHVAVVYDNSAVGNNPIIYINGIPQTVRERTTPIGTATSDAASSLIIGNRSGTDRAFEGYISYIHIHNQLLSLEEIKQNFNTIARLPFWSVNYTGYPDNVTEYTDNLPYSSSIISSGTFKVDDDKLQCVSAGTITYSASYDFDGSEYIKVEINGVEYAGTGTVTVGNTTVSVAQGSNKVTIVMGTGDTIEGEIGIQFREEV